MAVAEFAAVEDMMIMATCSLTMGNISVRYRMQNLMVFTIEWAGVKPLKHPRGRHNVMKAITKPIR